MSTMTPIARALAAAALVSACFPAQAYTTFLDSFTVVRNGTTLINDPFSDGNAPPSAEGCILSNAPLCFSANTPFAAGSESGGKLRLDTTTGVVSESAAGDPRQTVRGRLLTNNTQGAGGGLRISQEFTVSAVYDLVLPGPADAAQIRLTDFHTNTADPGHQNDYAQLQLRRGTGVGAVPEIRFIEQNFALGTITTNAFKTVDLGLNADQIRLILSHPTIGSPAVHASWDYLKAGVVVDSDSFPETGNIFDGEDWTRAEFIVSALPVPEPETYALMLLGIGIVAWRVRQQQRGAMRPS